MTSLLQTLRACDQSLFLRINRVWTCHALDMAMPALTDMNRSPWFWTLLCLAAGAWLYASRGRALRLIAPLGVTVGATDLLCYRIIKPLVRRLRPEYVLPGVILRAGTHSRYGFPSNHSANCFAAATFLSAFYPRLSGPAFGLAAVVAYSRVYVGAHFPLDVIGGALIGFCIGRLAAVLAKRTAIVIERVAGALSPQPH